MQFLKDCFTIDNTSLFMAISSFVLFFISLILIGKIFYFRYKDKKFFKQIDANIEYKISESLNIFLSSIMLLFFGVVKYLYFSRMDDVLDSLWVLFGIIFINIFFKIFCLFSAKGHNKPIKNLLLRIIDNFVMIITITLSSSIIASQIPIVDISKFFGAEVARFSLINLPFLVMSLFVISSCLSLILEYFFKNLEEEIKENINEILKVFIPLFITLGITIYYPLSYNLFIIVCIGVLSKYIAEKSSTYLNSRKLLNNKNSSILKIFNPISNIFFSSLMNMLVLTILLFTCLNYGGYFGITMASIGLICSVVLTSSLIIFDKSSESYKYLAKTINNIALFYIFLETLEYIYKQRITINIFSDNVIIGLFLGISFMLFNILKSINLIRYVNMAKSHIYLTIRTILYIGLFTICIYYLLPYINYELLAALVLGLILTTAFGSILLINSIDVFEKQTLKSLQITPIIRSTVLPLTNQITTILIIITVLLLPIIK